MQPAQSLLKTVSGLNATGVDQSARDASRVALAGERGFAGQTEDDSTGLVHLNGYGDGFIRATAPPTSGPR